MKKYIYVIIALISFSISAQDKGYWICWNFTVDSQTEAEELVLALDDLMESEAMSQFPLVITLGEIMFRNSNAPTTHQLCFIGPNADSFAMWGSGPPTTAEGKLVNKIFQDYAVMESSNMGSPLIFDPTKLGYEYASVWSIDVSNIPAYAKSVQEFISETKESFDGVFELHESISGGEDYVSHYFVARSNNLTDWLKGREAVFNSGAAFKFINSSQKNATTINNFAARLLRIYN